jgi:hypothetical protein
VHDLNFFKHAVISDLITRDTRWVTRQPANRLNSQKNWPIYGFTDNTPCIPTDHSRRTLSSCPHCSHVKACSRWLLMTFNFKTIISPTAGALVKVHFFRGNCTNIGVVYSQKILGVVLRGFHGECDEVDCVLLVHTGLLQLRTFLLHAGPHSTCWAVFFPCFLSMSLPDSNFLHKRSRLT